MIARIRTYLTAKLERWRNRRRFRQDKEKEEEAIGANLRFVEDKIKKRKP
jgi:hypothetical protein